MSIIENALHKAQQHNVAAKAESSGTYRRLRPDVRDFVDRSTVIDTRRYKSASTDPVALRQNHVLTHVADEAALRAYKILRTRVLQRLDANGWHSFVVSGTEVGEGKTLTAVNLAIALAQDLHTHPILVDLDLQRPKVASTLGMKFDRGLGDYLLGEAEIDDIIYNPGIPRLAVIPNGRAFSESSEYLSSPRMLELLRHLQAETPKRVLLFDMPPIMLSDDVLTFAPQADSLVLVVSEGHTSRQTLEKATEFLADINVLGVVLNRSRERNDAKYY